MGQPATRLGDSTSHGGAIISGSGDVIIDGMPAGRLGDPHACPLPGHAVNVIASGYTNIRRKRGQSPLIQMPDCEPNTRIAYRVAKEREEKRQRKGARLEFFKEKRGQARVLHEFFRLDFFFRKKKEPDSLPKGTRTPSAF